MRSAAKTYLVPARPGQGHRLEEQQKAEPAFHAPLWPKAMNRSQVFQNDFLHPFNHLPLPPPGRPKTGSYNGGEETLGCDDEPLQAIARGLRPRSPHSRPRAALARCGATQA